MIVKNAVLAVLAVLVCLSVCSALKCSGGVEKAITNRCELFCGEKDKCLCAKDENPSNITGCLQKCNRNPEGNSNITVDKCLDMECTGLKSCFQVCSSTTNECKMQCKATDTCTQECPGKCTKLVCSSPKCIQQCNNCTMQCTSDVKECTQQCLGGVCYAECSAEKCYKSCLAGQGEKCQIISACEKLSSLSFAKLIFLIGVLAKMIN